MAGIGGIPPSFDPGALTRADKDGSGGGGRYAPGRRKKEDQEKQSDGDQPTFSEEARKAMARAKLLQAADGDASNRNNQLHIITEVNQFNDHQQRAGSRLRAVLKPLPSGSRLEVEDTASGVVLKPFGDSDIFGLAPQAVRAKLLTLDRSSGSVFDGRV